MESYISFRYKNHPELYFQKSPYFSHKYNRFDEISRTGSQKVLWTVLNNLSRDWYWFLCNEFGLKGYKLDVGFLAETSDRRLGEHCISAWGKFPDYKISRHKIRYNLAYCRVNPSIMFFETIPHEVCHAITQEMYLNEIESLGHGIKWQEIMEFIGLEPHEFSKVDEKSQELAHNYYEILHDDLVLKTN